MNLRARWRRITEYFSAPLHRENMVRESYSPKLAGLSLLPEEATFVELKRARDVDVKFRQYFLGSCLTLERFGFSQIMLCKIAGISQRKFDQIVRGEAFPRYEELVAVQSASIASLDLQQRALAGFDIRNVGA